MALRRTGDWPRKTPLRSSKPLVPGAPMRSAPLSRRSGMSGVSSGSPVAGQPLKPSRANVGTPGSSPVADVPRVKSPRPKRPKVTAEERAARRLVRARSGGICEVCGRAQATNFQHRQNRSQQGAWTAPNGLDVCGSGTTGCHGHIHQNPRLAYERGWSVRSGHDPACVPVWLAGRGWHYLTADGGTVPTERSAA